MSIPGLAGAGVILRAPLIVLCAIMLGVNKTPAQEGPPLPPDSSAFRGNVFELQQQKPLPYSENFDSAPLVLDSTQSAHLVQVRQKLGKHVHANHDEIVYIISGRGIMTVGAEVRAIQPGDVIVIPRGTPHSVENRSPEPLMALSVMSPPFAGQD